MQYLGQIPWFQLSYTANLDKLRKKRRIINSFLFCTHVFPSRSTDMPFIHTDKILIASGPSVPNPRHLLKSRRLLEQFIQSPKAQHVLRHQGLVAAAAYLSRNADEGRGRAK